MIISKSIKIKINNRNLNLFKHLSVKIGDIVDSTVDFLQKGSHQKIEVQCDICGNRKYLSYQKYTKNIKNYEIYCCSSKCAQIKVKKTCFDKFGCDHYSKTESYKSSVKTNSIQKYGEDHHLKSVEIKNKISNTNLERYGSENPFSSELIKKKIKETNIAKYGEENPSKNNQIIEVIRNKSIERWKNNAVEFYRNKKINIVSISENGEYEIECNDHTFLISKSLLQNRLLLNTEICTKCLPLNHHLSGLEILLKEYIKSIYKGKVVLNDRSIIYPKELDIYLPDKKIAIEFNGLYWHSESQKGNLYHASKHIMCREKDIELIQIWEDDWIYKNEIVKSMISNKILKSGEKIYARKCEIEILNHKSSKEFLSFNHLHGSVNSKINIGLKYNGEIVSIMSFNGLRKSNGSNFEIGKYEMTRYCNKINTSVIGGGSRMISYFIKNYDFSEIVTYYDKSFGYKNFYPKIGFKMISETKPGYHYIVNGIRKHRYNYRKSRLIKMGYDKSKTEKEIMLNLKYERIFGPGNLKYSLITCKDPT